MLADNRIALNAGWDLEMLQLELKDLSALGADLSALGFTDAGAGRGAQRRRRRASPTRTRSRSSPRTAVTVPGDIWCLGPHRVTCGDSTDAGDRRRRCSAT